MSIKQPTEQLYTNRGSGEARLRPRMNMGGPALNTKVGPPMPSPVAVREGSLDIGGATGMLRRRVGLNKRFRQD